MPGKVPIDVVAKGNTRYKGETDKYAVPNLDPVMLAEQVIQGYALLPGSRWGAILHSDLGGKYLSWPANNRLERALWT